MQSFTQHKERDAEFITKVESLCHMVEVILVSTRFNVPASNAEAFGVALRNYLAFDTDQCLLKHDEMKQEWFEQHTQHLMRGSEALQSNEAQLSNLEQELYSNPDNIGIKNSIISLKGIIDQIRQDMAKLQEMIEREQNS